MGTVRSTRQTTAFRALATAICLTTLPGLTAAQEQAPDQDVILEGTANGQQVQIRLPDPEEQLPLEDLRKFTEVFGRIKEAYVEEVDDRQLLESAIKGMLADLDPHSTYLAPKEYEELEESTSGEFGGLGIEVGMEDGFIKVITPIDDTPAQKAGVQAGDLIIKLGDQPVKGLSLEEAVNLMRGKPGTTLSLTIMRETENAPIEIDVVRDVIKVTSIKSRLLEPGYGYVRITQFQSETGNEFRDAIRSLADDSDGQLDGLVIDVRNNPGGVLQAAVGAADALLDEGLIVYTEGRIQSSRLRFSATPGDIIADTPIVVLINGGSASASEILAGALQDHHRAVVMGTQSFGKGSVQTVIPLDETHAIKMTTARYFTPDGRSIQARGITPDIEVRPARFTEFEGQPFFTEADLSGHLENGDGEDELNSEQRKQQDQNSDANESHMERDFQLRSALNLLKGMTIFQNKQDDGDN
ncbi:S41 family peptidase [Marinobacter xestospongiae]|uniref:S41 family peptidase n=1 Tax=Marinobacter xestospongiae TaxID=994319 RepID=A0ABU3W1V3_9GAMM|nr:S41 family peptidase [Marinobacter xestospongiae]MCG8520081.1 S41 family peptidase [Pseudomonadales bacterium]MDV2080315.1 S41 family peptidase [Marinobacter xestospongiae]